MPTLLFVYGTLRRNRRGRPHPLLYRARFLGRGTVAGRLYDLGRYPALVGTRTAGERVCGELYALPQRGGDWRRLDRYEAYRPGDHRSEYLRRRVEVRRAAGGADAWCYVYNRSIRARRRIIPADYRAYQRRRGMAASTQGVHHG